MIDLKCEWRKNRRVYFGGNNEASNSMLFFLMERLNPLSTLPEILVYSADLLKL